MAYERNVDSKHIDITSTSVQIADETNQTIRPTSNGHRLA